mmetsp:Transcript_51872/g.76873  ORF Transcript_51872/g.76873 Transcript_51872/m.76873 type:complete len:758 (+) Transcript_51872:34-2307(+)
MIKLFDKYSTNRARPRSSSSKRSIKFRRISSIAMIITLLSVAATRCSAAASRKSNTIIGIGGGRNVFVTSRSTCSAFVTASNGKSEIGNKCGCIPRHESATAVVGQYQSNKMRKFRTIFCKSMLQSSLLSSDDKDENPFQSSSSSSSRNLMSDSSAMAKSRVPFSSPKDSFDDSVPILNPKKSEQAFAWSKLGLMDDIVQAVSNPPNAASKQESGMGLAHPTPVQQMVIPAILSSSRDDKGKEERSVAFAAATGSGKTLAYVLPILQNLKISEMNLHDNDEDDDDCLIRQRKPKRPRAIILAPTRELAHQILSVVKTLAHRIKLSSTLLVGGEDYGKQRKALSRQLDVVVATPGRLAKHKDANNLYLGDVRVVVIDEMDTMLEQGFQADIRSVLHPLLYDKRGDKREDSPRVVLTSATMTNAVKRLLKHPDAKPPLSSRNGRRGEKQQQQQQQQQRIELPDNIRILTLPGLHRAVPRLRQVFIDVGSTDKLSLLIDSVHASGGRGAALFTRDKEDGDASKPLTLVFCNTVASCRAAEHALAEAGIESLGYHGDLNSSARNENLRRFRAAGSGSSGGGGYNNNNNNKKKEEEEDVDGVLPRVLVCTDIASRGLDVPEVDHVIMFDFPLNPIDYLHRAGRTARGVNQGHNANNNHEYGGLDRAGNGRVTALVAKRDRVLAMAIEGAVQRGEPLDELSSRKTDYLPGSKLGARTLGDGKQKRNNNHGRNKRSAAGGRGGGRGGRGGRGGGRGRLRKTRRS